MNVVIIVAYSHDRAAHALVARWRAAGEDAFVLTGTELSQRGWVYAPHDPVAGRMALGGRIVPTSQLRAVVVRIPVLTEQELPHVHAADRAYAASEMQAFLLAWLSSLTCTVINRPTPTSLAGPSWHTAEWVVRARRLGIAARPLAWKTTPSEPALAAPRVDAKSRFIDVVGERAFLLGGRAPSAGDPFALAALALARDAGLELVRIYFDAASDQPVVLDVGMWVDLGSHEVADAITERCFGFVHGSAPASAAHAQVARA